MKRPGGFDSQDRYDAEEEAFRLRLERERAAEAAREAEELREREAAERRFAERAKAERDAQRAAQREAAERAARAGLASLSDHTGASNTAEGAASAATDVEAGALREHASTNLADDSLETVDLSGLHRGALDRSSGGLSALSQGLSKLPMKLPTRARNADPVRAAEKRLRAAEKQSKRRTKRETKRFTAQARGRARKAIVGAAIVVALFAFVLVGAFTPIMSVRDIRVEGAASVNAEEVTNALESFTGVPLALVDETDVLRALEPFPAIQRFAVERVPPKTLVVRIEERVPVIALEGEGSFRVFDAAGVLLSEVPERPAGVPVGSPGLANTSSKGFRAAAKVVRDMPESLRVRLVSVSSASGQDVTFELDNGVEVFWGDPEETRRKALVLNAMLGSLEGREVSHIDVSSVESPIFK